MQSMVNLQATYGLPLCVSGIIPHLSLSKEMADHDRRRQDMALKRHRSKASEGMHANPEVGSHITFEILLGEIKCEVDMMEI
ncbi:Fos-related antigen 2 like [Quillaja saponaria]|uniref:Fos-related antigen 2 like n=1 Tax=Quillaja saponaria TaxID=32244 RepID=A0AAD7QG92_QUISA|nr:Fos-related antigen 2 like [Quillaja saponaria]